MNVRLASVLYALALIAIPISVASKPLLGLTDTIWIDPTLILSILAFIALMPRWGDFLSDRLKGIVFGSLALLFLAFTCALYGLFLRPTDSIYDVLREPIRLALNLLWMLISAWFLTYKPYVTVKFSVISISIALLSGIYLYLVVFGLAPATPSVVAYMRIYFLRQLVWVNGTPLPRMGGLFIESPPFGLFMFSMLAVVLIMRKSGFRTRFSIFGIFLAALGIFLSMADQVLLGCFVWLSTCLATLRHSYNKLLWGLIIGLTILIGGLEIRSLLLKQNSSETTVATEINGSSIGERSFHFRYAMSLLQSMPSITILGIGPGRYGEYVAETGDYPNTVNIQTLEPEILLEWGVLGLSIWVVMFSTLTICIWRKHRMMGVGLILGLIVADSFQANWKYESVFLAIAVLCTRHSFQPGQHISSNYSLTTEECQDHI